MNLCNFFWISRVISNTKYGVSGACRYYKQVEERYSKKYENEQMEFIKSAIENHQTDWNDLKANVLSKRGSVNQKNFEAILLKTMVNHQKINAAVSFAQHLKKSNEELSLGSINGLLSLYYHIGKTNDLSDTQKAFILDTYKNLYDKYKILDYTTSEKLLHALCVIGEFKKCFKVLDDIYHTATPSHSAFSTIISTLFDHDKKAEAMDIIQKSLNSNRPLQDNAYDAWITFILRKYKNRKTKLKHLEEMVTHISDNFVVLSEPIALKIKETFTSLGWNAKTTKISHNIGQCHCCQGVLDCLKLSDEEFSLLQQNVKEKLIVGSDLFLKTSPEELKRFLIFLKNTAPYDIVLDALNIAFTAAAKKNNINKVNVLTSIVTYFKAENKKILLLGRKHMLNWPKKPMQYVMSNTCTFLTDDLSEDDPYFITAAIMSSPTTDIVSRDLLRGHRFQMKDEKLRFLFRRWQWQHQWMVFLNKFGRPRIQPPLRYTPCAQKQQGGWHLPFQWSDLDTSGQVHDGVPDHSSWLCLQPPVS